MLDNAPEHNDSRTVLTTENDQQFRRKLQLKITNNVISKQYNNALVVN